MRREEENATDERQIDQNEHQGIQDEQQDKQGEGQDKEKEQQDNQDGEQVDQDEQQYNQEDSNMADPVRLTAPDVHKDFTVRRRSFDDAQSRLKCRKLLGIGGKEPSKVLQVLGSHESYFICIPRGYDTWQMVVPGFLSAVSIVLLIFPSFCLRGLGDSAESSSFAGCLCCRLLASALVGIVFVSWGTKPTTISSIKRVLLLHSTYCGAATLFLGLACFSVRSQSLIVLTSLHGVLTLVSLFYFVAVRQLNKPTPEKPNTKLCNSDENHVN